MADLLEPVFLRVGDHSGGKTCTHKNEAPSGPQHHPALLPHSSFYQRLISKYYFFPLSFHSSSSKLLNRWLPNLFPSLQFFPAKTPMETPGILLLVLEGDLHSSRLFYSGHQGHLLVAVGYIIFLCTDSASSCCHLQTSLLKTLLMGSLQAESIETNHLLISPILSCP